MKKQLTRIAYQKLSLFVGTWLQLCLTPAQIKVIYEKLAVKAF